MSAWHYQNKKKEKIKKDLKIVMRIMAVKSYHSLMIKNKVQLQINGCKHWGCMNINNLNFEILLAV